MSIFAVQQSESAICVRIVFPSWVSFPPHPLSHVITEHPELSSLCYTTASCQLSILVMAVYICQCASFSLFPLFFLLCVHKSILYIWISVLPLQIVHQHHFSRFYVYAVTCDICFSGFSQSVSQFSRSVVSDSLWHHESQHARPPCPSPTFLAYFTLYGRL